MDIVLIGYGKMGQAIEQVALAAGDTIVARIDERGGDPLRTDVLQRGEVAIEFTRPESAFANIQACFEAGIPIVSGTTGWLERLPEARQLAEQQGGALFYTANYSIGVNLFFALNRYLAQLMATQEQYDVSLEEIHHTQKLDSPSGTAIYLANDILDALPRKQRWHEGPSGRPEDLIITSERIDPTPGTHTVHYQSAIDDISIRHVAHSREGFARGAHAAARWLRGRQGFFSMRDMLGL